MASNHIFYSFCWLQIHLQTDEFKSALKGQRLFLIEMITRNWSKIGNSLKMSKTLLINLEARTAFIHCKSFRHIKQMSLWVTRWGRLMRPLNLHTLILWSNRIMFAAWHAPKIMIQTWTNSFAAQWAGERPPAPPHPPTEQSWVWSALTLRAKPGLVPWRLPNFSNAERAQIPPARMGSVAGARYSRSGDCCCGRLSKEV